MFTLFKFEKKTHQVYTIQKQNFGQHPMLQIDCCQDCMAQRPNIALIDTNGPWHTTQTNPRRNAPSCRWKRPPCERRMMVMMMMMKRSWKYLPVNKKKRSITFYVA
jgi:hypothetical protein